MAATIRIPNYAANDPYATMVTVAKLIEWPFAWLSSSSNRVFRPYSFPNEMGDTHWRLDAYDFWAGHIEGTQLTIYARDSQHAIDEWILAEKTFVVLWLGWVKNLSRQIIKRGK